MLPARSSWYQRARGSAATWWRSVVSGVAALRRAPPRLGVSVGRAVLPRAELDLQALATSPTTFAAVTRRALSLTVYPIRVYEGWSIGGRRLRPLEPSVPWVGALLRLLQTPDEMSADALFPATGEQLIAQIAADLILTGNFFVAPVLGEDGAIIGLHRLHPRCSAIERRPGGDEIVYRALSETRRYPRSSIAHGRLLSWQATAQAEVGTGAGTALQHLVHAEAAALQSTADTIDQGGADLRIVAADAAGMELMKDEKRRDEIVKRVTTAISGAGGRRVFALGGNVRVEDAGFKPADLQAPALMEAARRAELVATGCVPVAVGAEAGTYATAVQQYRVQAEQDEALAAVIEASLLRPLARHFAKRAGGMAARRPDQFTSRIDLSQHPGYAYLRTDAISRMERLQKMGWTAVQAAEIEGMDLPAPQGTPMPGAANQPPGPDAGSHLQDPRRPVGDGADPDPNQDPNAPRTILQLLSGHAA